jgi:hypothetical protein
MNLNKPNKTRAAIRRCSPGKTRWRLAAGMSLVLLTGCHGAPSINLLGSFFPGWMLCMALGVAAAFVVRGVCVKTSIEPHLQPCRLVYFCLWGLISLLSWLLFFRS